jgi:transposase
VPSPTLDDDLGFAQRIEDLAVEKLIAQARIDGMDGPLHRPERAMTGGLYQEPRRSRPMQINVIGFDIAKHVFQVHAADNSGQAVAQIRLRRAQVLDYFRSLSPCLVGMEACATAHHWARELMALGHDVRLMPPGYVKAYVKRNKTDAADAEAIAEAVTRPTMRFVPVKSAESQAMLMLHRARELLVRQRTMLANAVRAHLAEFGIIAPQGIHRVEKLATQVHDPAVPPIARDALMLIVDELASIWRRIEGLEARLVALHRTNEVSRRLASIPGVGPITAMAIANTISDVSAFRSGREFAAWLGLTPKTYSSGGKDRLGRITKRGDRYIRHLLYIGAGNVIRFAKARSATGEAWIRGLQERRPPKVVIIALANKMARIAWALMTRGESFRSPAAAAA